MLVSPSEVKNGQLTAANLVLATRTLHDAGLVVLEGVYKRAWVARLRAAFDAELERYIAQKGGMEAINAKSFGKNHIGMHPPIVPPFSDPAIVANPIAVQVMESALGKDLQCSYYHTNTAYPGSGYQPIHRDNPPLFGTEWAVPHPIVSLVLNVPLCDFTEENGSTEVWPGTHLTVENLPEEEPARAAWAAETPSRRMNIPAGSLVLRDLRLFHRGVPNRSHASRAMLAIVYTRGWLAQKPIDIPQTTWDRWPEKARHIFRKNTIVSTQL
jgi:ectoine hydroxylase-related dioxygenase (phytanoyl-CoA dioxygenase family)